MTAYPWLKLWNEAPTDPKWLAVADMAKSSPSLAWHTFCAALTFANEQPNRGSIAGFDPRVIASFCRVGVDEVQRVIQALREFGLLLGERIAKWTKRQTEKLAGPRTANAERQARHRQKISQQAAQGVLDLPQQALREGVIPTAEEEEAIGFQRKIPESITDSESVAACGVEEKNEADSFGRSAPLGAVSASAERAEGGGDPRKIAGPARSGTAPFEEQPTRPSGAARRDVSRPPKPSTTAAGDRPMPGVLPHREGEQSPSPSALANSRAEPCIRDRRTDEANRPGSGRSTEASDAARVGQDNVVQLSAGPALKAKKKEMRLHKVFNFVLANYEGDEQLRRMNGLCNLDLDREHDDQWWFDHCDREMIMANWDDVRDGTRYRQAGRQ